MPTKKVKWTFKWIAITNKNPIKITLKVDKKYPFKINKPIKIEQIGYVWLPRFKNMISARVKVTYDGRQRTFHFPIGTDKGNPIISPLRKDVIFTNIICYADNHFKSKKKNPKYTDLNGDVVLERAIQLFKLRGNDFERFYKYIAYNYYDRVP